MARPTGPSAETLDIFKRLKQDPANNVRRRVFAPLLCLILHFAPSNSIGLFRLALSAPEAILNGPQVRAGALFDLSKTASLTFRSSSLAWF